MFSIEAGNIIKVTRGDTLPLAVSLTKGDTEYTPRSGDAIRFAISTGYKGQKNYKLILTKDIPTDSLTFELSADETQSLADARYNYDVQITYADGDVETFVSSVLLMLDEVE